MNDTSRDLLAFAGRILLAPMFLIAGFGKLAGFSGTVAYMQSKGMPATEILAALALVLEIGGGLALVFGFRTRWAALALTAFTLVATLIFHAFWAAPADQAMVQNLFFLKNVSVMGGLLVLAAFGPGAWSLDARRGAGGQTIRPTGRAPGAAR
jgi:putative oxidoreductase